jgi:DNA-binding CsgD family transcriptional regulator
MFEGANPWEKEALAFSLLLDSKIQNRVHEIAKKNHLTSREFDCLFHLSTGRTAKEIALALNISPRTVEAHIDKIRVKTTCVTQKEIIQWFDDKFSLYF